MPLPGAGFADQPEQGAPTAPAALAAQRLPPGLQQVVPVPGIGEGRRKQVLHQHPGIVQASGHERAGGAGGAAREEVGHLPQRVGPARLEVPDAVGSVQQVGGRIRQRPFAEHHIRPRPERRDLPADLAGEPRLGDLCCCLRRAGRPQLLDELVLQHQQPLGDRGPVLRDQLPELPVPELPGQVLPGGIFVQDDDGILQVPLRRVGTDVLPAGGHPRGAADVAPVLVGLGLVGLRVQGAIPVAVHGGLIHDQSLVRIRYNPVFPVYGSGDYQVQPVYVEDLAAQAVESGFQSGSSVADAAGPETFSFKALLRLLASSMGVRSRLLHTPPSLALALTGLVGLLMRDLALTRDEVDGLMAGLLTSDAAPTGTTRLSDWLKDNADGLGRRYTSELRRNYRR